jgi:hypothetical protein
MDSPANDQPLMQINNQSIANLVTSDHVGFNTNGSGYHEQVTFFNNNPPTFPMTGILPFPVLFTNIPAGMTYPQLFFYTGTEAASSTQYNNTASSGSTFLLGGIILKWGTVEPTNMNQFIGFSAAFPNACFVVIPMIQNYSFGVATSTFTYGTITASGFFINTSGMTPSSNLISYIAIGN